MTLPSRIMRLRLLPSYPVRDDAGTAIAISKSGGVQTTSIDYAKQSLTAGIADPSTATVLVLRATGEYERARLDQLVFPAAGQRTPRGDADYTVLTTDRFVGLTATLTAGRVWTLPAASAVPGGTPIVFADEVGGLSASFPVTITRAGSDTIDGASTLVLRVARTGVTLVSDGISKWVNTSVPDGSVSYTKAAANEFRAAPRLARTITSASSAGDRTLTAADIGKLVIFSGTTDFTVTLTAAATLANGWSIAFRSVGKCVVTLDPNSTEQIDGATTGRVLFRQSGEIICDGAAFYTVGKQSRVLLETQAFSAVSTVDFSSLAPGYNTLIFRGRSIQMSTAGANLNARFSIDNGTNVRATSGDYQQHFSTGSNSTFANQFFNTGTSLQFLVGNAAVGFINNFEMRMLNPNDAVSRHQVDYSLPGSFDNGSTFFTGFGRAEMVAPSSSRINFMRFLTSSGTTTGEIQLYGEE